MGFFIFQSIYFFLLALALAVLEIQIEGPHGWAAKLPTWRPGLSHWLGRFVHRVTGGEEVTGYHIALNLVLLLFFHWPYVWFHEWSLGNECYLMAFYVCFVIVWDFLWFVLNPHYSLKSFGPAQAPWHGQWLGRVPVKYIIGFVAALGLFSLGGALGSTWLNGLLLGIMFLVINFVLTYITVLVYPKSY